MAGKVTLYVRDDDLWRRARQASGRGGLSKLIHQCLGEWLERTDVGVSPPSVLERARRLRRDADDLVRAVEEAEGRRAPSGKARVHRRSPV